VAGQDPANRLDDVIAGAAGHIAARAERELEALVGVSSPSGDVQGAEEALAVCAALLPEGAQVSRPPCSTPGSAPDFLARVSGQGAGRLLLVGHVDTVIAHAAHLPLRRDGERLYGPGTSDMKGGVILSLGVMRALAEAPSAYAELALLLVTDEEWRTHPFRHVEELASFDACLCFEAGERGPDGQEGVVVKRKAAGTLRTLATGRSAHSGSAPDAGANALLALAEVALRVSEHHAPRGPSRLSVVPTVLRSGNAFNVVPAQGELIFDLRAEDAGAFDEVIGAVPERVGEVTVKPVMERVWPSMDTRQATEALLQRASDRLGRRIVGVARGGASDASHLASTIPLTVDGLGPRGGGAHTPQEFVLAASLGERAEVALALAGAALDGCN
jgi:glutamate carboxypeptidase